LTRFFLIAILIIVLEQEATSQNRRNFETKELKEYTDFGKVPEKSSKRSSEMFSSL